MRTLSQGPLAPGELVLIKGSGLADAQVAASKALIGAKSLKEVVDVSSSVAKTNLDLLVVEGSKLTQISTKLAEQAFDPLSTRVSATVERLIKTAA